MTNENIPTLKEMEKDRDEWRAVVEAVVDIIDPNRDHYYWRSKKESVPKTVLYMRNQMDNLEDQVAELHDIVRQLVEQHDAGSLSGEVAKIGLEAKELLSKVYKRTKK